jgi:hypothetical protein
MTKNQRLSDGLVVMEAVSPVHGYAAGSAR